MDVALYPRTLIPQTTWKESMRVDDILAEMGDFCMIRRADCSEEEGIDTKLVEAGGSPFLTHKALSNQRIGNMSMSILGALLQKDDIRFKQREEAMADWNGGEVDANRLIEGFVDEVPRPWFEVVWSVKGLHGQEVPYKKGGITGENFEQFKKEVYRVRGIVLDTLAKYEAEEAPLKGQTKVNHRPSNLNYWHITLDVYPATRDGYIEEPQDNSEKNLLKKVGNQLLRYSFRRYEPSGTIPQLKASLWIK